MTAIRNRYCFLLNCKTNKKTTENKKPHSFTSKERPAEFLSSQSLFGLPEVDLVPLRNGRAEQRTQVEKHCLGHRLQPHSAAGAPGSCSPGPLHHLSAFSWETFPGPKSSWVEARWSVLSQALLLMSICTKLIYFLNKTTETPPAERQPSPQPIQNRM